MARWFSHTKWRTSDFVVDMKLGVTNLNWFAVLLTHGGYAIQPRSSNFQPISLPHELWCAQPYQNIRVYQFRTTNSAVCTHIAKCNYMNTYTILLQPNTKQAISPKKVMILSFAFGGLECATSRTEFRKKNYHIYSNVERIYAYFLAHSQLFCSIFCFGSPA